MSAVLTVLLYATPLALAALGETVVQKSGVIHIGIEGAMLSSAFFAMLVAWSTGNPSLGLAAGVLVGVAAALVSGFFSLTLTIDQVVVGTAVNLLALGLTRALFAMQFGTSGQLLSVPKIPSWQGIDAVTVSVVLLAACASWALGKTAWGLALRASGEYPQAAEAAGFSVIRLRYGALAFGGAMAGLGGAYLSLGIAGSFADNMTAGRGFLAIAMVTFGRWKPPYVLAACLLLGWLEGLQFMFQAKGVQLPFQLFLALPYVAALAVLAGIGRGSRAPAALAMPFRRAR